MNSGKTVFGQIFDVASWHEFRRCVKRYSGDSRVRSFSCLDQFLCMAFGQFTFRESMRDVIACLSARPKLLYHMGIRGKVSRSTLSDANNRRDWRIFADFAMHLIQEAQALYADEPFCIDLKEAVYALDATVVDLSLTLFPWAQFRRRKSAVKIHTCLDLRTHIPTFLHITSGNISDLELLDHLPVEAGAIYVMDRGFTDFGRLYALGQEGAFFVLRAKRRLAFNRRYSRAVDRATGVICDQEGVLANRAPRAKYPDAFRRISYRDPETGDKLVFLTNHPNLAPLKVAQLYRRRWDIELFFKWIKQHLKIKAFYGNTLNAVKIQVWTAAAVYILIAIIKKRLHIDMELYTILQILSVTPFQKVPLTELLTEQQDRSQATLEHNQLWLPDL